MPLTFDLSLEELRSYQGTNPRPTDFDAYWDRALAEMHAIDPAITIKPAEFQTGFAHCDHLYFTGVGGARVHAKLLRPRVTSDRGPALLRFHGYSSNSGNWTDHLSWVGEGFTVAALDCRGQGGLSEDPGGVTGNTHKGQIIRGLGGDSPDKLLFRSIFLDAALLANIVLGLDGVDPNRLYAYGGSQGGALSLVCAALDSRVSKVAPVFPFLSDYKRVWEMDQGGGPYEELTTWFRLFDPRHEREEEVFTTLGYIDVQHLAPRIHAEVYMATGLMDKICPPSSQFATFNKITSKKRLELYPDFGHEKLPGHEDLVFTFLSGSNRTAR